MIANGRRKFTLSSGCNFSSKKQKGLDNSSPFCFLLQKLQPLDGVNLLRPFAIMLFFSIKNLKS